MVHPAADEGFSVAYELPWPTFLILIIGLMDKECNIEALPRLSIPLVPTP
jgi:hypothetical protein